MNVTVTVATVTGQVISANNHGLNGLGERTEGVRGSLRARRFLRANDLADPLTPEKRFPAMQLGPLDREALSEAMDWLEAYIVS